MYRQPEVCTPFSEASSPRARSIKIGVRHESPGILSRGVGRRGNEQRERRRGRVLFPESGKGRTRKERETKENDNKRKGEKQWTRRREEEREAELVIEVQFQDEINGRSHVYQSYWLA
jgi:hypothetical protein